MKLSGAGSACAHSSLPADLPHEFRSALIRSAEIVGNSAAEIHAAVLNALKDYEKSDDVTLFVMKRIRQ